MSVSYAIKKSNQKIYDLKETQKIQQELHVEYLRTLMEELMMSQSKSFSLERILPKTEGELTTALEDIQFTTTSDYSAFNAGGAFGTISCLELNINGNRWLLLGTSNLYFRQKDNNTNWYSVCETRNTGVFLNNDEFEIIISKVFSGSLENQIIMSKNLNKAYENYRKSCL